MSSLELRTCATCDRALPEDAFYANCAECKECKKDRSRRNRKEQARKIALAERFIDVLAAMSASADVSQNTLRAAPSAKIRAARDSREGVTS